MGTVHNREAALSKLLTELFDGDGAGLLRWVRLHLGKRVHDELPTSVPLSQLAFEATLAIQRHGQARQVFASLSDERPGQAERIQEVARMWGVTVDTGAVHEPVIPRGTPIARQRTINIAVPSLLSGDIRSPLRYRPARACPCRGTHYSSVVRTNCACWPRRSLDSRVLVEEFIQGTEVTGGVLGNPRLQVLPLVEISPSSTYAFFDYEAKYQPGATEEICPARLEPELTKRAQACALTAHKALGCRGYSRTDMMIRGQDIFVLETNTIPGMTATSLFPQAAKAVGLEFPELLDNLIELALEKE